MKRRMNKRKRVIVAGVLLSFLMLRSPHAQDIPPLAPDEFVISHAVCDSPALVDSQGIIENS